MSRIIAGDAGSLTLKVPQGATRPTSERVREAMFSSLEHRIGFEDISVLDLYAGSGALGFEALSRGASSLVAVDNDRHALAALAANARVLEAALPRSTDISIRNQSVSAFLESNPDLGSIDLVFIDPPYDLPNAQLEAQLHQLADRLNDALVVVERSTKTPEPHWPEGLELRSEKTYGDTRVFTLELSR